MFDRDILIENQRKYIRENIGYWEERYPEDVANMRKLFPVDKVENSLDVFIKDAFLFLNEHESDKIKFGIMRGPVDTVPEGFTLVSRPCKLRGNIYSPTVAVEYANAILNTLNYNITKLEEQGIPYIYYFYMWIPIYGINTRCGRGLMTHYAQKVISNETEG